MKQKTVWLILAGAITGLTFYLVRQGSKRRKWQRKRTEILERAKRHQHGEFVL